MVIVHKPVLHATPLGEQLPPAARPVLASLGLMERFERDGHLVSHGNRSLWGSTVPTETDFIMHPLGSGWRLDRARFDHMLLEAAQEAGTEVVHQHKLQAYKGDRGWRFDIDAVDFEAQFVVDASGRLAVFARGQGARRTRIDRLMGLVALVEGRDSDSKTLVEAVANGWWYSTQLSETRRVMGFMSDRDLFDAQWMRSREGFRATVDDTVQMHALVRRGDFRQIESPRLVAADTSRLSDFHGDGWLAVGDASLAFDPISSQGILTALQCGKEAARCILADRMDEYSAFLDDIHLRHVEARRACYAMEQRWPTKPFWLRRTQL